MGKYKKTKALIAVLLAITVLSTLAAPAMADEVSITRGFSTDSPPPNTELDVILTISGLQIGGIVETIPDGFTYVDTMHPLDQVNVSGQRIAFAVINETSIEYQVRAPASGRGTFTGIWEDLLNETNGTIADTSITVKEPTPTSSGGGSSSGGGHRPTPTPTSIAILEMEEGVKRITSIGAGEESPVTFEGSEIYKISIKVDKKVSNVSVRVMDIEPANASIELQDVANVSGVAYNYFNITATNLTDVNVTVEIEFKVNKSWITNESINESTIKFNRYDGNWITLPTNKTQEDNESVYYAAETTGFSIFAITGEEKVEVVETPTLATTPTSEAPHTITPEEPQTPAPASEKTINWINILVATAAVALVCIAVGYFVFKKR